MKAAETNLKQAQSTLKSDQAELKKKEAELKKTAKEYEKDKANMETVLKSKTKLEVNLGKGLIIIIIKII